MQRNDHSGELNSLMDMFERNTHNLLTFSQRNLRTFEKGQYGVVYAKLSRRLESVLSVDREVVVIFSSFRSQQPRTIKFARKVVVDEGVRLDPTLSIIVHKDPRGNNRLKNWGRQDGMTVLPVYYQGAMPAGEDLENALSKELFSHDVFDISGPVSDDSQFYGRRTEAQELGRKLQRGQIHACLGIRKVGKTSILNRVVNHLREYHDSICVVIDCSRDDIWSLDASGLMGSCAHCVKLAVDKGDNYVAVRPRKTSASISESSEKLIEAIRSSGKVVIILMDEVDYITPGNSSATHWQSEFTVFWRNFRAVYQELTRAERRNLSLLVSGVSSKWFSVQSINEVENAALSLIPEEYLSPLPRGATLAMIRDMSRQSGLIFSESARERIAEVSADIPFWVRKTCSFIHRNVPIEKRPEEPTLAEVVALLKKFVESEGAVYARVALSHLFTVYPELEEGVLSCYDGNGSDCPKFLLDKLRRYGIITASLGSYELSGDMMRAGFEDYLDERTSASDVGQTNQVGTAPEGDWAEDLATIGRKRNVLEKRLREIVIGYLSYDSTHDRSKRSVQERLLQIVPSERKKDLARKTSHEIIGSFLWSDLYRLILKEWRLFDPIFSDKRRFEQDCEIVNERPDAHAKDIDPADLALHRRALEHLTVQLDRRT